MTEKNPVLARFLTLFDAPFFLRVFMTSETKWVSPPFSMVGEGGVSGQKYFLFSTTWSADIGSCAHCLWMWQRERARKRSFYWKKFSSPKNGNFSVLECSGFVGLEHFMSEQKSRKEGSYVTCEHEKLSLLHSSECFLVWVCISLLPRWFLLLWMTPLFFSRHTKNH